MPLRHLADNLYGGVLVNYLMYLIELTTVSVLIWKNSSQHVERSDYIQLFTKSVGTLVTDTLTISYVLMS